MLSLYFCVCLCRAAFNRLEATHIRIQDELENEGELLLTIKDILDKAEYVDQAQ